MVAVNTIPTLLPTSGAQVTPEMLALRQAYAKQLLAGNGQPIHSWSEGVANMVDALVGGVMSRKAGERQAAGEASANDAFSKLLMGGGAGAAPDLTNPSSYTTDPHAFGGSGPVSGSVNGQLVSSSPDTSSGGDISGLAALPMTGAAGGAAPAVTPPAAAGAPAISQAQFAALMRNPFATPAQKAMALELMKAQMPKPRGPEEYGYTNVNGHLIRTSKYGGSAADVMDIPPTPPAAKPGEGEFSLNPDQTRYDRSGKVIAHAPAKAVGAWRPGTDEERKAYNLPEGTPLVFGPDGKPQVLGNGLGGGATANPDDVQNIAKAIINGDQPPVLTGLYRLGGPVRSELEKQGYNLTAASQDWTSTQKLLATMNGTQQTRLRQAVGQVKEGLPLLRDLAEKWNAGGFPVLNAANRQLAESGALGPEAQKIIVNLKSGIADITSEMGNVLMGGNSPTDHALDLAAQNLNADWSYPTFTAALDQMNKLIGYRENALKLGTAGIDNSQYNQMQKSQDITPQVGAPVPASGPVSPVTPAAPPPPAAATPKVAIPPQAIDAVKAHPELRDQFIQKYGVAPEAAQ